MKISTYRSIVFQLALLLGLASLAGCVTRPREVESEKISRRKPSALSFQREQCEMNSSQLVLSMTGDTGKLAANHRFDERFQSAEQISEYVKKNPSAIKYRRFPWLDNFLASEEQRLFALSISLRNNHSYIQAYTMPLYLRKSDWDQNLPSDAQKLEKVYDEVAKSYNRGELPLRKSVESIKKSMAEVKATNPNHDASFFKATASKKMREIGARKACGDLKVVNANECAKASTYSHDVIMNPMDLRTVPVSGELPMADISNLDMTLKILESSKKDIYLMGLGNYEKILVDHLKNPRQIQSNIWTDLVRSFEMAGAPPAAARERALEVLSVASTNGSDFLLNEFFFNYREKQFGQYVIEPTNPKFVTMTRISLALPYFDLVKNGNLYSLPSQYASECDTSKYYHFWMSAYLTRELIKSGFSRQSAAAAVLANHVGYRSLYDVFAADFDVQSPGHYILRTDLASVAMGILFGARINTPDEVRGLAFQDFFDLTIPDNKYQIGFMDRIASTAMESAQAYSKFMQKLGVISLWEKIDAELR